MALHDSEARNCVRTKRSIVQRFKNSQATHTGNTTWRVHNDSPPKQLRRTRKASKTERNQHINTLEMRTDSPLSKIAAALCSETCKRTSTRTHTHTQAHTGTHLRANMCHRAVRTGARVRAGKRDKHIWSRLLLRIAKERNRAQKWSKWMQLAGQIVQIKASPKA